MPTVVKEHAIYMPEARVVAILEGHMTQERRLMKPQGTRCVPELMPDGVTTGWRTDVRHKFGAETVVTSPFGKRGDHLWVRESWAQPGTVARSDDPVRQDRPVVYRASTPGEAYSWRSPMTMPRWACRLVLEVRDVRVERLQDVDESGAIAQGMDRIKARTPTFRDAYRYQWDEGTWVRNPFIWVLEFVPLGPSLAAP